MLQLLVLIFSFSIYHHLIIFLSNIKSSFPTFMVVFNKKYTFLRIFLFNKQFFLVANLRRHLLQFFANIIVFWTCRKIQKRELGRRTKDKVTFVEMHCCWAGWRDTVGPRERFQGKTIVYQSLVQYMWHLWTSENIIKEKNNLKAGLRMIHFPSKDNGTSPVQSSKIKTTKNPNIQILFQEQFMHTQETQKPWLEPYHRNNKIYP